MYTIATLTDFRRHLNLSDTDADHDLLRALQKASHLIESLTQRRYCPYIETRTVSLNPATPRDLFLPADLLELHTISDDIGPIDPAIIRRWPSSPDQPASILQRADGVPFRFSLNPIYAVQVSGIWGSHDRWTAAWRDSLDTVRDTTLTTSATIVTVADSQAGDSDGLQPRFQIGQLLRLQDEFLRITAIDPTAHRLTLLRAVAGTAAADHPRGTAIETYSPTSYIRLATLTFADLITHAGDILELETPPLLKRLRRVTV